MSANPLPSDESLVGHSLIAAAEIMGMSREQLAHAIGVSIPTIARMKTGAPIASGKTFEMALLLIRIYRALYAMVGGNQEAIRHWLNTPNRHLSAQSGVPQIPIEMIQQVEGLSRVLWYLDAMRGRM